VLYQAVIHGVCRMLCSNGTADMDVIANVVIVISTKLSVYLLDCSMSSVVHKMKFMFTIRWQP
jgi:hypothetical protein